jgi:peptide/nickel transport system permease protein
MTLIQDANSNQEVSVREPWWLSRPVRLLRRNRQAWVGASLALVFVLVALFAPQLAPPKDACLYDLGESAAGSVYNPFSRMFWQATFVPPASCFETPRLDFSQKPTPPRPEAWLGTSNGFDVWYGLIWGTRTAFFLSFTVVFASAGIGMLVGSLSAYFGGWVDNLFMRFTDVVFAFPSLVLIIVLVSLLGRSLTNLILAFVLTGWAGYARFMRGEVLKVRTLDFVEGARALGANTPRVLLRHVIPNSLSAYSATVILDLGATVLIASGLSFLGLGTEPGFADWGQVVNLARTWVSSPQYWYVIIFPGLTVILWGLAWTLIGDALRDAFNPKARVR